MCYNVVPLSVKRVASPLTLISFSFQFSKVTRKTVLNRLPKKWRSKAILLQRWPLAPRLRMLPALHPNMAPLLQGLIRLLREQGIHRRVRHPQEQRIHHPQGRIHHRRLRPELILHHRRPELVTHMQWVQVRSYGLSVTTILVYYSRFSSSSLCFIKKIRPKIASP